MIGRKLGNYLITGKLGAGGMGDIYLAHDGFLNRDVAVKMLPPELGRDPLLLSRFRREAELFARINHPNIVQIITAAEEDNRTYLVMEYVDGGNLEQILKAGRVPSPGQKLTLALQLCRGLAEIHRLGLIHRDIKPANVLINTQGTVKITDFGLAKSLEATAITMDRQALGTPCYMAPEQFEGVGVDHRSDIYSLGILLYELWTGKPPFSGDSIATLAYQHTHNELPPPATLDPGMPAAIEQLLYRATAKKPADRYQQVGELIAVLEQERSRAAVKPCSVHSGRAATFACPACGKGFCPECALLIDGIAFCGSCAPAVERCFRHADRKAVAHCEKCRRPVCHACELHPLGKNLCPECAPAVRGCFRHPMKEATAACAVCRQPMCENCREEWRGRELCYGCHGHLRRQWARRWRTVRQLAALAILAALLTFVWHHWGGAIRVRLWPYWNPVRETLRGWGVPLP